MSFGRKVILHIVELSNHDEANSCVGWVFGVAPFCSSAALAGAGSPGKLQAFLCTGLSNREI
jgi:hypothetical protein